VKALVQLGQNLISLLLMVGLIVLGFLFFQSSQGKRESAQVVWGVNENGNPTIKAHNLTIHAEQQLSNSPGGKTGLRISGNYVVWDETLNQPGKSSGIRIYDLAPRREIAIDSPAFVQRYADISTDGVVVWNDSRNATGVKSPTDIYGYDLRTGMEFPVAVGPGIHFLPRIDGNWIIYLDWLPNQVLRSDTPKLKAYNFSTGERIELGPAVYIESPYTNKVHAISGNRVVW